MFAVIEFETSDRFEDRRATEVAVAVRFNDLEMLR